MNTGNLNTLTEYQQNELLLIRGENEKLAEGKEVIAIAVDQHILHIKEHKGVLSDPDLRMDADLVSKVTSHIDEHIELLRQTDPGLLSIIGEQPLGPEAGTPPNMDAPGQNLNQAPVQGAPAGSPMEQMPPVNMPNMPEPPPPRS